MPKEREQRLKGFENKMWRKFEPKIEEETGDWKKMYKYELRNLFPVHNLDRKCRKGTSYMTTA